MVRLFAMTLITAICVMALIAHVLAYLATPTPQTPTTELKTDKETP